MIPSLPGLAGLFPDGDHRFHLTLRRGDPRAYFEGADASGRVLAERRHWIASDPGRYAALEPEGENLLREFVALTASWGVANDFKGLALPRGMSPIEQLGVAFEPDILFLSKDDAGQFRLRGGALCFPTGWALEDKIGHPLDLIHGVVPGLNAALAAPINQFLSRLKPGTAFLRDNWGLAATDELNLHPSRGIAAPRAPVSLERLWLRVEQQALLALPSSRGVAFGIRIALHRLDTLAGTAVAAGLRRALETMPPDLAQYKRIGGIRPQIVGLL